MADISRITLPSGQTYDIKDAVARQAISGGIAFHIANDAASTPYGVTWDDHGTTITGTLVASASTTGFYLVPAVSGSGKNIYDEYVTIDDNGYQWEKLGSTEVAITVTLNKVTDSVLGADTTFTAQPSSVTFSGGTTDTFVKSYPGVTGYLETTSIKGVGNDVTFTSINSATSLTATDTVFGTDTSASAITTTQVTATDTSFDDPTTASKATAGTAFPVAKAAGNATNISRINYGTAGSGGPYDSSVPNPEVINTAYVASGSETLVITAVTATQDSVTGTNGTETITPYTFENVTVPVVLSNTQRTFDAVSTNTSVAVPVVSSNTQRTLSYIETKSTTAATSAANATVVATGNVVASDSNGDAVLTGLGTPTTDSAVTSIGTGTAAAQSISANNNDDVTVLTSATSITVS